MGFLNDSLSQVSGKSVAVFAATSFTLYFVLARIDRQRRRAKLGGKAPRVSFNYLPFGIDFVLHAVRMNSQHRSEEHWNYNFAKAGSYTVEATVLGSDIVLTADPENVKAILATQFPDYGKGKDFADQTRPLLGDSIFSADGDVWHASRQLVRPQFIKDRVSDLRCFEKHVQNLFRVIENGGPPDGADAVTVGVGRTVNISNAFFRFALDVTTEFLLGDSVNSWCKPEEPFAEAFDEASDIQSTILRSNALAWLVPRGRYNICVKVIDSFINTYIDRALRLSPEELETKTKSDADYTFLHAIAAFTRDRKVLRDQIFAVLLAGRDTTASTLSFCLFELARRPDVVAKMRREILDTVGPDAHPTYRNLKDMSYLRAVINESLRLYPAVPYNTRVALKDTTLPRGGGPDGTQPIGILRGTIMGYSTLVMQKRPDIHPSLGPDGPATDEFHPERWEKWFPKGHEYIPFNSGPRICVGQQYALTEMAYALCRLFQRYETVESRMEGADAERPVMRSDLTLKPGNPILVAFFEPKE